MAMVTKKEMANDSPSESGLALSEPLTEFHCFKKLPDELQLRVWEEARPEGRVVKLIPSKKVYEQQQKRLRAQHVTSRARIPGILHACFDSRKVALKWYELSFGWHRGHNASFQEVVYMEKERRQSEKHRKRLGSSGVYVDWEQDLIYVQCHGCHDGYKSPFGHKRLRFGLQVLNVVDGAKIKHILMDCEEGGVHKAAIAIAKYCPNIVDITVFDKSRGLMVEHEARSSDIDRGEHYLPDDSLFVANTYAALSKYVKERGLTYPTAGNNLITITGGKLDRVKRFNEEFDGIKVDFEHQGN